MKEDIRNIVNTIKLLGIDMIDNARGGYPGITLDAAPMMYTLFANHLNINPQDDKWLNRDRFVLSASHASALLYATLFLAGYNINLDDLVLYRRFNSKTPGFVSMDTPGIDYSGGPLGSGLATAVGMAMAEKYLKSLVGLKVKNQRLINHNIYCLVSDGDLQEGLAHEAAAIAGLYNLGNLIVLYDSNNITEDGRLEKSGKENILKIFDACGWQIDYVKDGSNVNMIDKAIKRAKRVTNKPSIIEVRTLIGKDSYNQGTNLVHSRPLSSDDITNLRKILKNDLGKFEVKKEAMDKFRNIIKKRCSKRYKLWQEYYKAFKKKDVKEIQEMINFLERKDLGINFNASNFKIQATYQEDLRESNSKMMNIIAGRTNFFLGGSADMSSSCKTYLNREEAFTPKTYYGKNIRFGVRENAMGHIVNGLATYGLLTYSSTHLRYLDFMKNALRSSATNKLPVVHIFTNDFLSDDGFEEQPLEQLSNLRSIVGLDVFRPGDINEIIGVWDYILKEKHPSSLVVSNEITHILAGTDAMQVAKGAYIVRKEAGKLEGILLTCGRELTTSLIIANELEKQGIYLRVVSCVSQDLFDREKLEYKKEVLPEDTKVIVIEASSDLSWTKYTDYNMIIGVRKYQKNGSKKEVMTDLNFTKDLIKNQVLTLLGHNSTE